MLLKHIKNTLIPKNFPGDPHGHQASAPAPALLSACRQETLIFLISFVKHQAVWAIHIPDRPSVSSWSTLYPQYAAKACEGSLLEFFTQTRHDFQNANLWEPTLRKSVIYSLPTSFPRLQILRSNLLSLESSQSLLIKKQTEPVMLLDRNYLDNWTLDKSPNLWKWNGIKSLRTGISSSTQV